MGVVRAQPIKYGECCVEVGKHTSPHKYDRKLQCIFPQTDTHIKSYTHIFQQHFIFYKAITLLEIKISHRETDPASSLQWR